MNKLLLTILLLSTLSVSGSEKIYVWDFTTRDLQINESTTNLTIEFETALQSVGCLSLIDRRSLDQILQQRASERAIYDLENASPNMLKELKIRNATGVIFGEIYDDKNSGQIRIQVKLQDFTGQIVRISSIRMDRGKISDGISRELYMSTLAKQFCEFFKKSNRFMK